MLALIVDEQKEHNSQQDIRVHERVKIFMLLILELTQLTPLQRSTLSDRLREIGHISSMARSFGRLECQ